MKKSEKKNINKKVKVTKEEETTMTNTNTTAIIEDSRTWEELIPTVDELNDVEVETKPATTKKAKMTIAEKKAEWLKNAKLNSEGKYEIIIDPDLDNRGNHKSWTPYARLVNKNHKTTRITWEYAMELAITDKAVEVSLADVRKAEKAEKEAKKAKKTTKAA